MKRVVLPAIAALLLASTPAAAQLNMGGPRFGFSSDPDQVVLGGQLEFGPYDRSFTFTPNLEIGLGDDLTTIQFNADGNYHFDVGETWNPYVGAGFALAFYDWDSNGRGEDSETDFGANLIGGVRFKLRNASAVFAEMRIGVADVADLKLIGGWNFPL